jgi:hypothetical protein
VADLLGDEPLRVAELDQVVTYEIRRQCRVRATTRTGQR